MSDYEQTEMDMRNEHGTSPSPTPMEEYVASQDFQEAQEETEE